MNNTRSDNIKTDYNYVYTSRRYAGPPDTCSTANRAAAVVGVCSSRVAAAAARGRRTDKRAADQIGNGPHDLVWKLICAPPTGLRERAGLCGDICANTHYIGLPRPNNTCHNRQSYLITIIHTRAMVG